MLDGVLRRVSVGDVLEIPAGTLHGLRALCDLELTEVEIGAL
jgi:mannose-6-phosphate isomerase-like protein (cupin superfamily)